MSGSSEIPDFVGSVTNALGLNRLWQTDQQADSEKRKSDQEGRESADEEARRTAQATNDSGGWGKGKAGTTDHDAEVHGVPKSTTPNPSAHKGKGYEWPMPASLKDNQPKKKYGTSPTEDDHHPQTRTSTDDAQNIQHNLEHISEEQQKPDKLSFKGSLKPFLNQQNGVLTESPQPIAPQSAPLHKTNPFERPRPASSSSRQKIDRPPKRRQFTMPARAKPRNEAPESSKSKTQAKSRWQAAAHGLRFPIRRRKTDRQIEARRGSEVITTLAAGAPAANLLASHMLLDEHSHHRTPIIVDLLKVSSMYARLMVDYD
jgi:hypothetical protein